MLDLGFLLGFSPLLDPVCLQVWESPSRGERSWLLPVSHLLMVKGDAMGAGSSILPGVLPDPLGSHQESKSRGSSEWV